VRLYREGLIAQQAAEVFSIPVTSDKGFAGQLKSSLSAWQ